MSDKVAFPAQIKLISVKSLLSNDIEGELKLRFLPTNDVLEVLHRLHRGDANVMVVVMPLDNENNREIQKRKQGKQGATPGGEV
jgi:hypothetical protein